MKNLFLLPLLAVVAALPAHGKTTKRKTTASKTLVKKKASAMPAEVRASFPKGATSLFLRRMPMGSGGQSVLVHLWAAGRHAYADAPGYFADPSPFCVDVFAWGGKESEHPGRWERRATSIYLSKNAPDSADVKMRWLDPGKKQAPVLVIVSPDTMSTRITVITYPDGIGSAPDDGGNFVQDFYQGGVGGGKIIYDFGVDARGLMTIVSTNSYAGRTQSITTLAWNGREFAAPTKPKQ